MPGEPSRRQLLRTIGIVGGVDLAGCSIDGQRPPELAYLLLSNDDQSTTHSLSVQVEQDDEIVHWESYRIAPDSLQWVSPTWEAARKPFDVQACLDDCGTIQETDSQIQGDAKGLAFEITIVDESELVIARMTPPENACRGAPDV